MDRRERSWLCLMVQLMAAWCMLATRMLWTAPTVHKAMAEADFTAEVIRDTPTPSPTLPAPTPSPVPTPSPAPTPEAEPVFEVEVIREDAAQRPWEGKRVLISHSHTWEAYEQVPSAP